MSTLREKKALAGYDYLIVGGGMAAAAAANGIREVDSSGTIGMFSVEPDPPYNRPPLSKALWKGEPLSDIWRETNNVELHLSTTITHISPREKRVERDDGNSFNYGKLLLATGGQPKRLGVEDDGVIYFRTLEDYRRLRTLTESGSRFAVIGGGFIGSETAAALAMNGKEVAMIFSGKMIAEHIFPADLAKYVSHHFEQKGVELLSNERVIAVKRRGNQRVLKISGEREIVVDGVVAGIGIKPNLELAESAGLKTGDGIVVDSLLRTSNSDIFAAGDVALFPSLGTHRRVEHEDNANSMGRIAGRNMAGKTEHYNHLPLFYSDLFDLGYEAVGELNSQYETFADWKDPHKEGVVFYLHGGRVRGVLLWNVWEKIDAARNLITDSKPFDRKQLKGLLT